MLCQGREVCQEFCRRRALCQASEDCAQRDPRAPDDSFTAGDSWVTMNSILVVKWHDQACAHCTRNYIAQCPPTGAFSQGERSTRGQWSSSESPRIGLRIPVATLVALVAEGEKTDAILALYPDLEADDMREALLFAAEAVRERSLPSAAGE